MPILLNNNHLPTPLNANSDPAFCVFCDKHVEYDDDYGWVHDPPDHTEGDFTSDGEWSEYANGPEQ